MTPGDLTTSAGRPMVWITIQLDSGYATKEKVEAIVSKLRWTTFPEGKEIRFSYSWNPPKPYEIPQNTPKGQEQKSEQPTDITGRPIQENSLIQGSEQVLSFSLTPEGAIEDRWYQVSLDNSDNMLKNFEHINPRRGNLVISRFNLTSSPTIQNVEICKKSDEVQKVIVRFSEPVFYKSIKLGLGITLLADGSSCAPVEDASKPEQASFAEFLCSGLGENGKSIKVSLGSSLISASSKIPLAFLDAEASVQGKLLSTPHETEIDFGKISQREDPACVLWTP
jgi:hypothetical protein